MLQLSWKFQGISHCLESGDPAALTHNYKHVFGGHNCLVTIKAHLLQICVLRWTLDTVYVFPFYCCVLQLLTSVLSEMRNAAQTKNNFVEVHLNGLCVYLLLLYQMLYTVFHT